MTAPEPIPESPLTAHNRKLCAEVMRATKTFSRYPRVSEQVECLPLETHKLKPFAYNPSINSKGWMVYRYHVSKLGTRLAFAQLGENGAVLLNREIQMPVMGKSLDDPKLFTHNGEDYLSWVEATWDDADYQKTIRCVVRFGKFDGEKVADVQQPALPGNDGKTLQKNYALWSHEGSLMCLYQCRPTHLVYEMQQAGFKTWRSYETDAPKWPYGEIRGDTAPLPYEGKLLRFFHSRLSNETAAPFFRYYLGAVLMEPEPPFKVVRVSRKPIVYGSEISGVKRKDCPHWKANVVFGGSAVEANGGWTLPIGVNDSECVLAKITPEQLNF